MLAGVIASQVMNAAGGGAGGKIFSASDFFPSLAKLAAHQRDSPANLRNRIGSFLGGLSGRR